MNKEPFLVLMAEDDEHDIVATRRAWKRHHITNSLYIVNDGEECLDFLYHRGKYKDRDTMPQPGILLTATDDVYTGTLIIARHGKGDI
jgi:hypothetical protein